MLLNYRAEQNGPLWPTCALLPRASNTLNHVPAKKKWIYDTCKKIKHDQSWIFFPANDMFLSQIVRWPMRKPSLTLQGVSSSYCYSEKTYPFSHRERQAPYKDPMALWHLVVANVHHRCDMLWRNKEGDKSGNVEMMSPTGRWRDAM